MELQFEEKFKSEFKSFNIRIFDFQVFEFVGFLGYSLEWN